MNKLFYTNPTLFLRMLFKVRYFCLFLCLTACSAVFAGPTAQKNAPLCFIENKGQISDHEGKPRKDIHFILRSPGMNLFVGDNSLHYQFEKIEFNTQANAAVMEDQSELQSGDSRSFERSLYRLDVRLLHANPSPGIRKEQKLAYYENYYNLPGCEEGITGVNSYARIVLENVYPHIDWVFYIKNDQVEYDFIVHPGGDASKIRLQYEGADGMEIRADGSLQISTPFGKIIENRPQGFIESGIKTNTPFRLEKDGVNYILSFRVDEYAGNQTLTIDPVLEWSSYYGGTTVDECRAISTDSYGNVYFAGSSASKTNISSGGHQNTNGGDWDAIVVKLNSQGNRLWATYYGGSGADHGRGISIDKNNNVFAGGITFSTSNIAFSGFQNVYQGTKYNMFLAKFNTAGTRIWATYYEAEVHWHGSLVSNDLNGNVYLCGIATAPNIAASGHQNILGGGSDAVLIKFNTNGQRLWATYYGGSKTDLGFASATDKDLNVYLCGSTSSDSAIASGGHKNSITGDDAFLVKFDSNGVRQWGTYYGGSSIEEGTAVACDIDGNVYMAGETYSIDDISFAGHQSTKSSQSDAFLVKFSGTGARLWATYYGGNEGEHHSRISTDPQNNVFLAGLTESSNNISYLGYADTYEGTSDGFLVKFDKTGKRIWGTYYGGPGWELLQALATDLNGNVYIGGFTTSTTKVSYKGFQNSLGGSNDAFITKFFYQNWFSLGKDFILCEGDSQVLDFALDSTWEFRWSNGDTTKSILLTKPGLYLVEATKGAVKVTDSITVRLGKKPVVYLGSDTAFCGAFTHLLDAGPGFKSYLWNTGDTTFNKMVDQRGLYSVTIADSISCSNADTIQIEQLLYKAYTVRPDTPNCKEMIIDVNQPGNAKLSYLWNTGDTTASIKVGSEWTYWFTVSNAFCSIADTAKVVFPKHKTFLRDSILCTDFSYQLNADPAGSSHTWNTGATGISLKVSTGGNYFVIYRDTANCILYDTALVTRYFKPAIVQSEDTVCPFINLSITGGHSSYNYLWGNGSTSPEITVITPGKYVLNTNNAHCHYQTETNVESPQIHIALGPDTTLCLSPNIKLTANQGSKFLWSTGETTADITVQDSGVYWIISTDRNCSDSDTVHVSLDCTIFGYVPNAFTPNGDGLNDLFKVSGDNIISAEMHIYNRWGQLIFSGTGPAPGWDGKFSGEICPQETYIYQVTLYGRQKGELTNKELMGDLTLLR